jgi:hypothetical protein
MEIPTKITEPAERIKRMILSPLTKLGGQPPVIHPMTKAKPNNMVNTEKISAVRSENIANLLLEKSLIIGPTWN